LFNDNGSTALRGDRRRHACHWLWIVARHVDAALSLEVYAKVVERTRDTGERIDALMRGPAVADGLAPDASQFTESS
jgi:hypothetical protein